jgi:hypothetical protein
LRTGLCSRPCRLSAALRSLRALRSSGLFGTPAKCEPGGQSQQKGDDKVNVLVDVIVKGLTFSGFSSPEEAADTVANQYNGSAYLYIKDMAWGDIVDYYTSLG